MAPFPSETRPTIGVAERIAVPAGGDPLPSDRFLDREQSWLDFNARVLALAADPEVPLLERARFVSIFATNLDEFFMVRVAGLKRRIATGIAVTTPTGLSPREQLELIAARTHDLVAEHAMVFAERLAPQLGEAGVRLVHWAELADADRERLHILFRDRVYPVLTPLAVDPAHPFPYISGLSLNLAVVVRDPAEDEDRFARVKVPPLLPRFLPVDPGRFLPLEDLIAEHLPQLFPGLDVVETHTFRVTRNEDLEVEEDDAEDLLQALERELSRRRFGPPVRLEVDESMSERVLDLLVRELGVTATEVYRLPGPLDLSGLSALADVDRPDCKYPAFVPATHPRLRGLDTATPSDLFSVLDGGDVLVHHPYDSFSTSVQAFVEQAAADPSVLAIKLTLYRTSGDSPIVDALIDAAECGKQVLVSVEIKARFDEQANIRWARALEQAGCHVVYGVIGLKTHAKLCLVVRQLADGSLRRYAHIGTGNYNPKTARIYEDLGLLTADPEVGADLSDLFNHLSGYTRRRSYRTLLVAPDALRPAIVGLIDAEIEHARAGDPAGVRMKLNSLVDEEIIDALYRASRAGVPVDLVIRGMCALRPGVAGLSDTIRVRSILGRFLEHSRILHLVAGGKDLYYIGSADMMHRNLDRRVEALVSVRDRAARRMLANLLDLALTEDVAAWALGPDGRWVRHCGAGAVDYQLDLIRENRLAIERAAEGART
ncbi:MAG TPA: RNA degradosome polyphosphate kinase [Mycobacteriales bacterium]|nr:RNA degradosome polyphosphate kinase [Mycobacteriales bacterium]